MEFFAFHIILKRIRMASVLLYTKEQKTEKKQTIRILDAGAGSGILSCAFLERLGRIAFIKKIELTCYENDSNILGLLKENLKVCQSESKKDIPIRLIAENYITSQYFPRSWTSGAYFKRFRQYLLTEGRLEHIHLFVIKNKVFEKEDALQETMIVKVKKTNETPQEVTVTSSQSNNDFASLASLAAPYGIVASGKDLYVYLVTNKERNFCVRADTSIPANMIGYRVKNEDRADC